MIILNKLRTFLKREAVLTIAAILAIYSCFMIPPDKGYLAYIDAHTLILLFSLMAVMAAMKDLGLFQFIGQRLLKTVKSERGLVVILVFLCFFSSMIVTNDVALITFIPFGILVLRLAGMEHMLCLVITLMTIAANLGSMLTPIGNPQNLFLYSASHISIGRFLHITIPYTLLSGAMLAGAILFTSRQKEISPCMLKEEVNLHKRKLIYYLGLFALCLLSVAGLLNVKWLFVIILAAVFIDNKGLLLKIDYSLLATFLFFFIFIGNMGRLPVFQEFIIKIVHGHERLVAIGISQVISNVPAALLLSGFTMQWRELIIGTNLGGLGTLIASMASLISYKQIAVQYPNKKNRYLLIFTAWNLGFLAVIYSISGLIM